MNCLRRCFFNSTLLNRLIQEKTNTTSVRFLYNEQFLGIDKYVEAREKTLNRIGNMKDNFYLRMKNQINSQIPCMVFTEDLKTVIHTCEDKSEEIDLCIEMMKRFHKQNKELRFGTFIFGPVAMRLFYYLKKQDIIDNFFKDPEFEGFFDQLKSYLLRMDLYYKNGMYNEIIDAYHDLKTKQLADTKFPREAMVLTVGACYKLNTKESYELATGLITDAREARVPIIRKALTFVIALALKQNRPDVALEILSSIDRFNNITGNNLKLMALAGLDRTSDAFDILRRVTDQDAPMQTRIRGEICQCTLDEIQKSVDKADDKETSHIFEQLCRSLKESNSVTSQTIDDLVSTPIEPRQFRDADMFSERPRSRFPEQGFRARERDSSSQEGFPERRRRFAGLSDDY